MAIRILALCAVLLLPVTMCQAVIDPHAGVADGGFENDTGYWRWAYYGAGSIAMAEEQALYTLNGSPEFTGYGLEAHEGNKFLSVVPDGRKDNSRPQIVSAYQELCVFDGWWQLQGSWALDQLDSQDYSRVSVVRQNDWNSFLDQHGQYDGYKAGFYGLTRAWTDVLQQDTVGEGEFGQSWWRDYGSSSLAPGTYVVVMDTVRHGTQYGYSVAGFDSISHTPEPSLGLLLLVGMIPVAIGFRRRRRS